MDAVAYRTQAIKGDSLDAGAKGYKRALWQALWRRNSRQLHRHGRRGRMPAGGPPPDRLNGNWLTAWRYVTDQLLATKLCLPRIRLDAVARPRLVHSLDAALTGRLTLISAPVGFGKTTLLRQWADE